jgi:hypothetical protein
MTTIRAGGKNIGKMAGDEDVVWSFVQVTAGINVSMSDPPHNGTAVVIPINVWEDIIERYQAGDLLAMTPTAQRRRKVRKIGPVVP